MATEFFRFKKFEVRHAQSSMRVGTDAVLLGAWVDVDYFSKQQEVRILDIGCGCGVISLMVAQRCTNGIVKGVDIDKQSVDEANENAVASPFGDRVSFAVVDIREFRGEVYNKYDLIFCNPPYYTEDTLPPDSRRSIARNAANLSFADLLSAVCRELSQQGVFAVIIPMNVRDVFLNEALIRGLFIKRECHIRTTLSKTPKRVLFEFVFQKDMTKEQSEIVLLDNEGNRSEQYVSLCKDFYL